MTDKKEGKVHSFGLLKPAVQKSSHIHMFIWEIKGSIERISDNLTDVRCEPRFIGRS